MDIALLTLLTLLASSLDISMSVPAEDIFEALALVLRLAMLESILALYSE